MASISREANGRRTIQFVAGDGSRKSIRLGKVSQRAAESVKIHVERLIAAIVTGYPVEDETSRWLASLDETLSERLAGVGLIPKRDSTRLGEFLESFVAARSDVKTSTRNSYERTRKNLVGYFEADAPLRNITPGDADAFRLWMTTNENLADNTMRRRTGIARQFFKVAVRRGLISANPFEGLAATVRANPDMFRFVTLDESDRIIEACPDVDWRVVFALCRFGGLRCPSEVLALRWSDVDWAHGRFRVTSPKTEHHPGGASRMVPLFAELLLHLREAFELAEPGAEWVVERYRAPSVNLRTHLSRIIRKAGLEPWPKLFQNLRSTRETELADAFPLQAVCAWIGNSQPVAAKHYLQVTDEHFERAAGIGPAQRAAESGAEGARIPANGDELDGATNAKTPGFSEVFATKQLRSRPEYAPGRTRTSNLQIRSLPLYPIELRTPTSFEVYPPADRTSKDKPPTLVATSRDQNLMFRSNRNRQRSSARSGANDQSVAIRSLTIPHACKPILSVS